MYSFAATAALLAGLASAKQCVNLTIPITASARQGVFNVSVPSDNIDVTNFILLSARQGTNYTAETLTGYATVSGNYDIAATYCEPDAGPGPILQILTHGIGFDRTYWDVAYNNYNYSYTTPAVDQEGYSTFSWDRLGVGNSSHGDPINEIQAPLELDALRFLTKGLRAGNLTGISPAYGTVVHVGHSFGSDLTYGLTEMYPTISDGIVLTGFSQNASFIADFELGGNFVLANGVPALAAYPAGYLAAGDPSAVQINFLAPGDFDPNILPFAYAGGEPVTYGELLTQGSVAGAVNNFTDPVLIITGENDVPFCGGNCLAPPTGFPNIPSTSKAMFPDAKVFDVDIVPGAGHGLNLQYTAQATYQSIFAFLAANGLAGAGGSNSSSTTTTSSPTATPPPSYPTGARPTWTA